MKCRNNTSSVSYADSFPSRGSLNIYQDKRMESGLDNQVMMVLDNVSLGYEGRAVIENIPPRIEHGYDCIMRFEHGEAIDHHYVVLKSSRSC